ncbi:helix-turn-helix transcriptional regulator [Yinghuangia seranimata]|uniref:helix-turn-helix transcriptional regulator n=1 Tax=Yinghuangia seranimata TaxID=408067 RepID=UPI00248BAE8F|nr:helix-turn-helix transcriptional regulator [Yinghuangia seranimata]MDI2130757.1 helix-turn-helix transcriptional regulator [Yinghuangia seranimata]
MLDGYAPPGPRLAGHVERYWWREFGPGRLPLLLPGTGAELWIHLGGAVRLVTPDGARDLPAAHLVCLRRTAWSLDAPDGCSVLAVRLRAGALAHLARVPVDELADAVVAADDLWGADTTRVIDDIRQESGPLPRIAALERVLGGLLDVDGTPGPVPPEVDAAVSLIYRRRGGVRIDDLAAELGVGVRWLQRAMPAATGVRPKEFQRLARFQHVVRVLLLSGETRYLEAALDAGFFDQNHFIREFRAFTGSTPGALLTARPSHFYYGPPSPDRQSDHASGT